MVTQQQKIIRVGLVIVLVAALSVLLLVLMGNRPSEAYNTRTITQMHQYITVLELIHSDLGQYPGSSEFACLGEYADGMCWDKGGTGVHEDMELSRLIAHYLPLLPAGKMVEHVRDTTENREGYIYRAIDNGQKYEIRYALAGTDKDCGAGEILRSSEDGEITICHITR